ncbi:hypothetical protein D9M68_946750 [compost metagenome]
MLGNATHRRSDVGEQATLLGIIEQVEQRARLHIVVIAFAVAEATSVTNDAQRRLLDRRIFNRRAGDRVRLVIHVRIAGLDATEEVHRAIFDVAANRALRRVDRQCFVMGADAVTVRVGIGE